MSNVTFYFTLDFISYHHVCLQPLGSWSKHEPYVLVWIEEIPLITRVGVYMSIFVIWFFFDSCSWADHVGLPWVASSKATLRSKPCTSLFWRTLSAKSFLAWPEVISLHNIKWYCDIFSKYKISQQWTRKIKQSKNSF